MSELADMLEALAGKATPGPWAYRPQEHDDWGVIRTTIKDGDFYPPAAVARGGFRDDANVHRRNGTDPHGPNAMLIVELVNALPTIIKALRK